VLHGANRNHGADDAVGDTRNFCDHLLWPVLSEKAHDAPLALFVFECLNLT
jgi:hypothetical protein